MNTYSRIYGKMIKYYSEESYKGKEIEIQAGFKSVRSTVDRVFAIKQLIQNTDNNGQEAHSTFVDVKKESYD